ncbi:MAG: hypothetical protein ACREDF_01445, partial [Thermoplasmata archaeon]
MSNGGRNREERLLDGHLGRLAPEERAHLETELQGDVELRAASERLGRMLRPLDQAPAFVAPTNLADRVLARVHATQGAPTRTLVESESGRILPFPAGRAREWIAVAACILLLLTVSVPGVTELRNRSRQALCGNNLADIFRGLTSYRESLRDMLPFSGRVTDAAWLPGSAGRAFASNSRHLFLLPKLGLVQETRSFVCPCDGDGRPMQRADFSSQSDFAEKANLSYDSWNLAGLRPIVRPGSAVPYLSDAGPFFVRARFDASVDVERANSPAHRGRGQSVLM